MTNYNSANNPVPNFYRASAADFKKIPGSPIAYWTSEKIRNTLSNPILNDYGKAIKGLDTCDNDTFVRVWHEVSFSKFELNADDVSQTKSNFKWFPFSKGGVYRKWYGNFIYVVNWGNDGLILRNIRDKNGKIKSRPQNTKYYFKKLITWTDISSSYFGARFTNNAIFGNGSAYSPNNPDEIFYYCALLNSKFSFTFFQIINQTFHFHAGDINKIPVILPKSEQLKIQINDLTQQCFDITKGEWDSRETSWDFTTNELLHHKTTTQIEAAYNNYCIYWKDQFFKLHANEEELNHIFIDIYDLTDDLTPNVPLEDITILKDESEIKDGKLVFKKETLVKQFISYAVGCMFGRYSPDKEGLILANQGEIIEDFREKVPDATFMPDEDNIIPILEDEYFTDDIVSRFREFLKVTFGAESLAENLEFIAGALSKSKKGGGSPEKVIRDYFLKSFFKDHVKMYKKRPIYWLFTSGKGRGFNALVYMHRYHRETLAKMRTDYLLELETKLDARIGMLGDESAAEKGKLGKQVEELMDYDAVLNNKALEFIDIDLDDGVKVNYAK